jgi:integrase/recombinase XerD
MQIYQRMKIDGVWRFRRVSEGQGKRTAHLQPPFYIRPVINGRQRWKRVDGAQTFAEAKDALKVATAALDAAAKGLTVAEAEALANKDRTTVKSAFDAYIARHDLRPKSVTQYKRTQLLFTQSLRVRFLDEITVDSLRAFKKFMGREGYAGKTADNRLTTVYGVLNENGIKIRLPKGENPRVAKNPPKPYTDAEIGALFAVMTPEENIRFKFFLGTGCREQEVQFAAWSDIDFERGTYHICEKRADGFVPKSHESRDVPMHDSLVAALKAYRKKHPDDRWLFPTERGIPDGHLLRMLKRIAKRAGVTTVCKLHMFRKTCATRWHEAGVPMIDIMLWLGHKDLATTQLYLGATSPGKLRDRINKAHGD